MVVAADLFAERLLDWYRVHGRHDLPWQSSSHAGESDRNLSLYRTWISEIMLQQTQVATVIPYYQRFMKRFSDIASLAQASQDDVLLHWAGLGYYSRARNLHKAAVAIAGNHDGCFPTEYEDVLALPGIGPSTAGAILAQALDQRYAILDGNVKRVLARHEAVDGWPGQTSVEKQLWQYAEAYTPGADVADYTQAIMDLGATVCTRSSAKCTSCPLSDSCQALATGRVDELPGRKPKKTLPVREKRFLIIRQADGRCLMEKRPPAGIWGGLWSLPELPMELAVDEAVYQNWRLSVAEYSDLPVFRHSFSHFHLDITPCEVDLTGTEAAVADEARYQWHEDIESLALAAPVSHIMRSVK